jgi:hypothetical protein
MDALASGYFYSWLIIIAKALPATKISLFVVYAYNLVKNKVLNLKLLPLPKLI